MLTLSLLKQNKEFVRVKDMEPGEKGKKTHQTKCTHIPAGNNTLLHSKLSQ